MVSQASSENSTSIGVRDEDAEEAVRVLNEEFSKEILTGAMFPMIQESGLSTIAIVGENMKHTPGIAGKLFGTLGRSGISVIACAQGASETNISFVVESKYLRKSLNVIHDSFFLSEYKVLNLFICGVGTVGSKASASAFFPQPAGPHSIIACGTRSSCTICISRCFTCSCPITSLNFIDSFYLVD